MIIKSCGVVFEKRCWSGSIFVESENKSLKESKDVGKKDPRQDLQRKDSSTIRIDWREENFRAAGRPRTIRKQSAGGKSGDTVVGSGQKCVREDPKEQRIYELAKGN